MTHAARPEFLEVSHLLKLAEQQLKELSSAIHNQNLEKDGQTFAGKVLENQRLRNRLAMLEDGAMTNQRLVWLEDQLQRAEAVVEAARALVPHLTNQHVPFMFGVVTPLIEALAAWDAGKERT